MKTLFLSLSLALPLHASESGIEKLQKALAGRAEAFERIELKADGSTVHFDVKLGSETAELEGAYSMDSVFAARRT